MVGNESLKVLYYPGCTLYEKARHLDQTARESAKAIGIDLIELSNWTCCGAAFPLASDNKMGLLAPTRILATAAKEAPNQEGSKGLDVTDTAGSSEKAEVLLTTLCAFCYNVLRRTNKLLSEDEYKLRKVNEFLEENYQVNVKIKHLLEILRDDYGFENMANKLKQPLSGLKVVPYYGCQLLRPFKEIQMDDPERPTIMEDFLSSLGCDVTDFPFKNECCGSYQIIDNEEIALKLSYKILNNATKNGAEAIALSCPVCYYNLDKKQEQIKDKHSGFQKIPVFYFTELLAIALKLDIDMLELNKHFVDPVPLLEEKQFLEAK
ncbi:CoB--CoM heterodisulfide reductase iron-sulfur subunit B family protein [[Eubacterium] cellulosolvens]